MADTKPIILSEDNSLVGHDLVNVYNHWSSNDTSASANHEVKFKKKENFDTLKKSVLKHRIRLLTGKDVSTIESEIGKALETDEDLRKFAKLLILEASGKLPMISPPAALSGRKRTFVESAGELNEGSPSKKKTRRSIAVVPRTDVVTTPQRKTRKSMLPQIPAITRVPEEIHEEPMEDEAEEEDVDLSQLGPNPTPQMIELQKKKAANAKGKAAKTSSPPKKKTVKKAVVAPAKTAFSGEGCFIYLIQANIVEKSHGFLDLNKLKGIAGPNFQGANLTLIHTPQEWNPTDIFSTVLSIKLLNRQAGLDSFLVMVACGIDNINLANEALKRQTKHVHMVIFEKEDMNANAETNDFMLQETTTMFLLAYFFPGCDKDGSLPPARMVRPNLTTCFRTKDTEDLENSIINAFSEKGDWLLDVCCEGRELSLAAQKSGRNAMAFGTVMEKLESLAEKASAIASDHDPNFRPDLDGRIITL